MDQFSTLDPKLAPSDSPTANHGVSREVLQFPGNDGGKSLAEMAVRDLDAALQLLTERAQYITGASGAAIALREGGEMTCRASAGSSAPEVGAHLQVESGLSGESVRTGQILRCDDAETDPRVNRESCRALGIASVVVMPLLREKEVIGVFELFSDKAHAFEERDLAALERMAEMIHTALEHTEAAKRAQAGTILAQEEEAVEDEPILAESAAQEPRAMVTPEAPAAEVTAEPAGAPGEESGTKAGASQGSLLSEPSKIRKCEACGFPVSEGRTLCLDCEKTKAPTVTAPETIASEAPAFLSHYADGDTQAERAGGRGWILAHKYILGALALVALVVLVLLTRR
jgi:hypothetical protein